MNTTFLGTLITANILLLIVWLIIAWLYIGPILYTIRRKRAGIYDYFNLVLIIFTTFFLSVTLYLLIC